MNETGWSHLHCDLNFHLSREVATQYELFMWTAARLTLDQLAKIIYRSIR